MTLSLSPSFVLSFSHSQVRRMEFDQHDEPELVALEESKVADKSVMQKALEQAMRDRNTLQVNIRLLRSACADMDTSREVILYFLFSYNKILNFRQQCGLFLSCVDIAVTTNIHGILCVQYCLSFSKVVKLETFSFSSGMKITIIYSTLTNRGQISEEKLVFMRVFRATYLWWYKILFKSFKRIKPLSYFEQSLEYTGILKVIDVYSTHTLHIVLPV